MFKQESKIKRFDFILFFTAIALSIFGFVAISSATMSQNNGSGPFLKTQIFAFLAGLVCIVILSLIDFEIYGAFFIPIYIISNLLLVAVLLPGIGFSGDWGSQSWIDLGVIRFQPAEIAKFGLIISLAKYLDIHKEDLSKPIVLLKVLAFAFFPVFLIMEQPDFGTAVVFAFFIIVMIFIAGIDYKYVNFCLIIGGILLAIFLGIVFYIMQDYEVGSGKYQFDRIVTFLNPEADLEGRGYQVIQSKTAIGSGLIFGRGLYQGVQNQLKFLPTKETDFIFAVICEELGLVGGLILISLYVIMMFRLIRIAKQTTSMFGSLIVTGIIAMLLFHIFENIGMTMGLMPVTGIPLPFISYGGTFMLVNMISIGLSLGVGLKKNKLEF